MHSAIVRSSLTYTEQISGPSIGQIVRPHIGCQFALYYWSVTLRHTASCT